MAAFPQQLPKWHMEKLMGLLDNADTKCRMIASRSKMPTDLNHKKVQIGS